MPSSEERARIIEIFGNAYAELVHGIAAFPREMWDYRADFDPWTIQEIIVHIADSESNSFVRCRRLIAEPGSAVMAYNEEVWAKELNYAKQDADDALQLFRWLRGNTYNLIKTLPASTWANTVQHSENGIMSMDDWLDIYTAHVSDHLAQMKRIHEDWLKKQL
ncbi:MAG TPA: DinB family protein [Chloroflexia bacterium]|nr:DinB family protein [Chloroflexia bacterium]